MAKGALIVVLLTCACSSRPSTDLGLEDLRSYFNNDGSVPADLAGTSCAGLYNAVNQWISTHKRCTTAADCTVVQTWGCLPASCGDYVNNGAAGPYLDSLISAYRNRSWCQTGCAVCTGQSPSGPPQCVAGQCDGTRK
jgi:hypothetical protein